MTHRPRTGFATRATLAVALAGAVLAAACSSGAERSRDEPAGSTATTTAVPATPRFEPGPCPTTVPTDRPVRCGTVAVPEDRTRPDGRRIELAVVVVSSTAADKAPDPVVYLHGGPGSGRLIRSLETIGTNPFLARRDLVLFDQRGVGRSEPDLNCPERELAFVAALTRDVSYAEELTLVSDALAACHSRLASSGVDLSAYQTVAAAADLDDLRRALGVEEWNLWSISYGTRLALEALRSHPEGIRSVILDSVYPTTAGGAEDPLASGQRAFAALAAGCAADPVCDTENPDVTATLERAARSLDRAPYRFTWQRPDGPVDLVLTGDDLVAGLFNALYDTALVPLLPDAITAMSVGDRGLVPLIADMGIPFINDITEGAFLSYECADNGARIDRARVDELRRDPGRAGLLMISTWQLFCDRWPVDLLPAAFGEPVRSDVPALVIAGEYDPITPPEHSRATADGLSRSRFVLVPRGGHGPGFDTACTTRISVEFLDRLDDVDTSCAASLEPLPFQ